MTTLSRSPVKLLANSRDLKFAPTDGYASPSSSPSASPLKSSTDSPRKNRTRRGHSPSVADDDPFWVVRLNLKESDREMVRHGKLNDKIIDAVNTTVAEHLETPTQTTLIAQSPIGFAPCDIDRPIVAVLHGIEHWVTVALRDGDVHYVDILRPHQPLSTYVIRCNSFVTRLTTTVSCECPSCPVRHSPVVTTVGFMRQRTPPSWH